MFVAAVDYGDVVEAIVVVVVVGARFKMVVLGHVLAVWSGQTILTHKFLHCFYSCRLHSTSSHFLYFRIGFADSTPSPPLAVSINALRSLNNSRVLRRPEIMNSEELNALNQNGDGAVDASVSKWQLKGKRNVRPLMKKPMEGDEINRFSNGAIGRSSVQWDPVGEDFDEDSDEDSLSESDGLPPTVRTPSVSKRCWSSDYSRRNFKSELFDVVLTVQKTYQGEHQLHRKTHQGEHVPLVSLMSRLNGKAIIGHPIQIEKLEDGFSSNLVRIRNDLAPVWRTGRRTTVPRVPRPHPSTTYHGDDPPYHYESNSHRWRLPGNKSPKKPIKRASLWNQKTKSLSSIRPRSPKHVKNFDDLIRPNAGPTIVTCIPVKLVFSRLLEAVGRPPSR
ncbi:hypothetical protein GIB67_040880 [Kingdonia uniflora]|uniref:Uncharacterized protein n=1 Tax=Kingdonia uniflora TaxID=39325 RepID=A0A7J7L882_9MAGN|nr:hypothetical protein GIB67_040880 [Kingdonia uniflora]